MLNKKSAMFGLDARIALAIFGALSVITGAVLVNAMKSLDVGKWTRHFEECVKASEAYYLDSGVKLPQKSGSVYLKSENIFNNVEGVSVWNGPYFQVTSYSDKSWKDSMSVQFGDGADIVIMLQKKSDWTNISDYSTDACVVNDSDCVEWIALTVASLPGADEDAKRLYALAEVLDSTIDGGDGFKKGKIRYIYGLPFQHLMYQGMPHKRLK